MAYVSGVTVEIPDQATRPREPARPSRAFSLSSQMMASRIPRPREGIAPSAATNLHLDRIAEHSAQKFQLEQRLKRVGYELHAANAALRGCRVDCGPLQHRVLVLQHEASSLIEKIRKCAAAANAAASAAVQYGASMLEVRAVAYGFVTPQHAGQHAGTPTSKGTLGALPGRLPGTPVLETGPDGVTRLVYSHSRFAPTERVVGPRYVGALPGQLPGTPVLETGPDGVTRLVYSHSRFAPTERVVGPRYVGALTRSAPEMPALPVPPPLPTSSSSGRGGTLSTDITAGDRPSRPTSTSPAEQARFDELIHPTRPPRRSPGRPGRLRVPPPSGGDGQSTGIGVGTIVVVGILALVGLKVLSK